MLKITRIASLTAIATIVNKIQYSSSNILLSFRYSRMQKNQVGKRTSARLMQRKDNNDKLSLNSLQEKKNENKETVEHTTSGIKRKRKTNAESTQDEFSVSEHEKSQILNSEKQEKGNKKFAVKNKRQKKNITDHDQSANSSKSSKHDSISTQDGQKLNDKILLVKYKKRLEDLKKNHVYSTTPIFETLCTHYEMSRNDSKAAAMSKYMRNKFPYFGIPTPQRKEMCADLWDDVKELSPFDLRTLAHQTWFSPEREFQYFTVSLLEREMFRIYQDDCQSTADLAMKTLDFVKMFIEHPSSWWDTVDSLAANVVGALVQKYPSELLPEMDKWNASSCFWLCRTSIIYQLSYKEATDADRLFRYCLQVADEQEFFIRKAIGWALRQYYRTDPKAVRSFVMKHKSTLSPLSVKEALKHDK